MYLYVVGTVENITTCAMDHRSAMFSKIGLTAYRYLEIPKSAHSLSTDSPANSPVENSLISITSGARSAGLRCLASSPSSIQSSGVRARGAFLSSLCTSLEDLKS